jgi:hypothetical protein
VLGSVSTDGSSAENAAIWIRLNQEGASRTRATLGSREDVMTIRRTVAGAAQTGGVALTAAPEVTMR